MKKRKENKRKKEEIKKIMFEAMKISYMVPSYEGHPLISCRNLAEVTQKPEIF